MPIDEAALTRSLEQLTAGLQTPSSAQALTSRLAVMVGAAREVLAVECVGLLLLGDGGRLVTVATTGPASTSLEHAQEDLGVGPGVDVLRTRAPVAVADLAAEPAYPRLWERVRGAGVRAVVSGPVWVGRQVVGNLNGIRPEPHDWSPDEVGAVEGFAGVIGTLLGLTARATPRPVLDLAADGRLDGSGPASSPADCGDTGTGTGSGGEDGGDGRARGAGGRRR